MTTTQHKDAARSRSAAGADLVLESLIPALSDGVLVIAPGGEIVRVNDALSDILGLEASDLLGKGWAEIFFGDLANQELNQVVVEVLQSHTTVHNRPVDYITSRGAKKRLTASVNLLSHGGEVLGLVAVLKDHTELMGLYQRERSRRQRARRQLQVRQEGLDRIARAVAHKVRNPVAAIGGLAARVLKVQGVGSKIRDYMERILELTARLETIVSQVRSYANLPRPKYRPVDMVSWMRGLLDRFTNQARKQKVEMSLDAQNLSGLTVSMDPQLIFIALSNMMVNALEAMPRGGRLTIRLEVLERKALVSLRDTGRGVPSEDLPFVFDPFFTTKAGAVGMSLALSQRIISEHRGEIQVESQTGRGTVWTVSLPLSHPQDPGAE